MKIPLKAKVYLGLIFCSLFTITSYLILFDDSIIQTLNTSIQIKNLLNWSENFTEEVISTSNEDCDNNQDFIEIQTDVYVRQASIKYFIDKEYMLMYFLSRVDSFKTDNFNSVIEITRVNYKKRFILNDCRFERLFSYNNYQTWEYKCYLSKLDLQDIRKSKIMLKFVSPWLLSSKHSFKVTKKLFREKNTKNQIALCLKPIYLSEKDLNSFKWWIEMTKYIGYSKIIVYNNSIPNNPGFNELFKLNSDYIDVYDMKCLPNFIDHPLDPNSQKYFRFFTDLIRQKGAELKMNEAYFYSFEMIALNECYHQYSHQYKYIFIHDQDEILLPSLFQNIKSPSDAVRYLSNNNINELSLLDSNICTRKHNNESLIVNYTNYLKENHKIPSDHSLYFPQYFYAGLDQIEYMFEVFDKKLGKKSIENYSNEEILLEVFYNNKTDAHLLNVTFQITSKEELIYAKNLLSMHKNVIRPFINKYKNSITKVAQNFGRFYFYNGDLWHKDHHLGKSMHNPDSVTRVHSHTSLDGKSFNLLNEYISHFRNKISLPVKKVSIYNFNFDINYFSCYFVPIFKKISNII